MATLGELKALAEQQLDAYHATKDRIRKLEDRIKEKKQTECPHTKTYTETEPGYFEQGKMRHPAPDERYQTCCHCKKRLGRYSSGPEKLLKFD